MRIKITGMNELRTGLDKRMDLKAVRTVVQKNGADLQGNAQEKAPVDTGTLKRSIGLNLTDSGLTATVAPTVEYAPLSRLEALEARLDALAATKAEKEDAE